MDSPRFPAENGIGISVPLGPLLEVAQGRLARQAQYARPLAKGGFKAATLRGWFTQAAECLGDLAQPRAYVRQVEASACDDGVRIAGRVTLPDAEIARAIRQGGTVSLYLLTLGYGQPQAFQWLGGDYSAHHVQSDLGNEVLFALGRQVHAQMRADAAGARLRRVPIQAQGLCGARHVWDPAGVQALLGVFDADETGVSVTDTGCFAPLASLLGLTIRLPQGVA